MVDAWQETDGPTATGTIITERVKMGPVVSEPSREITASESDKLCVYEGDSELGHSRTACIFEALGNDTRLAVEVNVGLSGCPVT